LVELPPALAEWGFLVEPLSIAEKALEHARATRSAFDWRPESAVVLGTGSLGLLTLARLSAPESAFDRRYALGRRSRPDPTIAVVDRLDATYVDSRETPVSDLASAVEPMDLVYEATGHAKHAVEAVDALAPNGVAALLGLPEPWTFEFDGGGLHRDLVMGNRALVGSVNAGPRHFRAAVETLADLPDWLPEAIVTDVVGVDDIHLAFDTGERTIKTAVEFHDHEER
jgi:threonine dehydrogenase-like Zn-dependent dehydrogenase